MPKKYSKQIASINPGYQIYKLKKANPRKSAYSKISVQVFYRKIYLAMHKENKIIIGPMPRIQQFRCTYKNKRYAHNMF